MDYSMASYQHNYGQTITTDADGVVADRAFLAHLTIAEPAAASTTAILAAKTSTTVQKASSCVVAAASAETDILTIAAPLALGAAPNILSVELLTADDDELAVTDDELGVITIELAKTSANKNTASLIQEAIRALVEVAGVDVSEFTCAAGGNWDSAAVATGEGDLVEFEGGQTAAPDIYEGDDLEQPDVPRNITATAGGTAGDIAAVSVIIEGTNYADEDITETLAAFTVDTAGTKSGTKAFKTVTKVTIPAADGEGATVAIGYADKLGLPYKLARNTVLATYLDDVLETTAASVTVDEDDLEKNTLDPHSACDGSNVDVYLMV